MKKSLIILTNESEKCINTLLEELLKKNEYSEMIIFDNHSLDNTVPNIVSTMGVLWSKEDKYKFYINKKKEDRKVLREKAVSIAKYEPVIYECY